jgi:uncharacterized Zn-finger protein
VIDFYMRRVQGRLRFFVHRSSRAALQTVTAHHALFFIDMGFHCEGAVDHGGHPSVFDEMGGKRTGRTPRPVEPKVVDIVTDKGDFSLIGELPQCFGGS